MLKYTQLLFHVILLIKFENEIVEQINRLLVGFSGINKNISR